MATASEYLDRVRRDLWAKESFGFIPDIDLPPAAGTALLGSGPRVAFAGFPSDYSVAFLLELLCLEVEPAGLITSPGAHPAILGNNALSRIADHLGIPLLRAWRINDEHSRMHLAELHLDAVVMASFDQIVATRTMESAKHGWLNIHPSPLPRYRGPEPVYWAIADGAPTTGITLHRAARKVDAGGVLRQEEVAIDPGDTAGTLTKRLVQHGVALLPGAVTALLRDEPGTTQESDSATYRPSVGHRPLESAGSAAEAERMVRAGVPNMPAWARIDGRDVYVMAAAVRHQSDGGHGPHLRYADGDLEVTETSERCGCHHDTPDCPHRTQTTAAP